MSESIYANLLLEEYKTLRDESKQASINMWTAVQWGSAILGGLFGIGLTQWVSEAPTTLIVFGILIPAFSFTTMSFWLGEAARFKRAGDYLYLLERKAEFLLRCSDALPEPMSGEWPLRQREYEFWLHLRHSQNKEEDIAMISPPLMWESWLRMRKGKGVLDGHLAFLYALRLGFFPIVSTGSLILVMIWIRSSIATPSSLLFWTAWGIGISFWAVGLWFALIVGPELNRTAKIPRYGIRGDIR